LADDQKIGVWVNTGHAALHKVRKSTHPNFVNCTQEELGTDKIAIRQLADSHRFLPFLCGLLVLLRKIHKAAIGLREISKHKCLNEIVKEAIRHLVNML